ncbi:hypothetical protein ACFIJ5_18050 (plasmid) [Haloimpatiens sp. FM7330]|uniref:hypothetical protein n=1 Tax=Haloimpatiens sp. FM7330 TaxID=3298610 RepID=UPI003639C4B4
MKAFVIYLLPSAFYIISLCYFILIVSKSTIVTTIVPIVYVMLKSFYENTLIDFSLAGSKIGALASGEKLPDSFIPFLIKNRVLFILLGIILLAASIYFYSPMSVKKRKNKESKASKIKINYTFKIQSKIVRRGVIGIVGAAILLILLNRKPVLWNSIKIFFIIIPLFLTVNVLSDEYIQHREGILFTCKTPIYKQMLIRFFHGWIFSEGAILICYLFALALGLEYNLEKFLAILIISTFLSMLGLTFSNLSKKPLLGYIVPIAYWVLFLAQGARFNEKFMGISVMINLILTSQMVWSNIISLSVFSIILLLFNIWYIGKGEKIRKPLLKGSCGALAAIFIIFLIFSYNINSKRTIAQRIIKNTKDTIYVLACDDNEAKKFLEDRGIKYVSLKNLNYDNLDKSNAVFISDTNCENIKKDIGFKNKIKIDDDGISIDDFNIVDGSSYRVTAQNPRNIKKSIVFMESKDWTENELKALFDKKTGNFIALKDDTCLFKSNYSLKNPDSMIDNMEMAYKGAWLMKKKEDVKIMYRNIPKAKVTVDDLLDIWYVSHKELNAMVEDDIDVDTLQIYFMDNPSNLSDNALKIRVRDRRKFDAPTGNNTWIQDIAQSAIDDILLKNISDKDLKSGWGYYLFNTRIVTALAGDLDKYILDYNYREVNGDIRDFYGNYADSLSKEVKRIEKDISSKRSNIDYASANILYSIDNEKSDLYKLIDTIYKSDTPIDKVGFEKIFNSKFALDDNPINFYSEVKEKCDNYGTLATCLVPVHTPTH